MFASFIAHITSTMGASCNHASSILLCVEDNSSILGFYEEVEEMGTVDEAQVRIHGEISVKKIGFFQDSRMIFPLQSEECLNSLLEKETEHLPAGDYSKRLMNVELDISARKDAVHLIHKAHADYSFGHLSAYLSVNYLDRFLSAHELPQGKAWMMQLLAVACLSLAIKMEETIVPLSVDLQVKVVQCYEALQHIRIMEESHPPSTSSMPQSPIDLLDVVYSSCNNSDESISSSQENSHNGFSESKKRKLNNTSAS